MDKRLFIGGLRGPRGPAVVGGASEVGRRLGSSTWHEEFLAVGIKILLEPLASFNSLIAGDKLFIYRHMHP
jgi:hypothetical protein